MNTKFDKDMLHKIRQIEIYTRRVLSGTLIGDYSSAKKGSGFEFDQIRDYTYGDDVRFFDWKGSARTQKLLIKQYVEERSRSIMLLVDVSGSMGFGSHKELKQNVATQIACALAIAADYGKDFVGSIVFDDTILEVIPPRRGTHHIHHIMRSVFSYAQNVRTTKTNIKSALQRLISLHRKDMITFLISDFLYTGFSSLLRVAARKGDLIAFRCYDPVEQRLPRAGILSLRDPEYGDMASCKISYQSQKEIQKTLKHWWDQQAMVIKRCGVDLLDIPVNRPFVGDVIRFFRRRMVY